MNLIYFIAPLFTNLCIMFGDFFPLELLKLEYIGRVYFSLFTSLYYIINLGMTFISISNRVEKNIIILHLISMFNFISGNSFIQPITHEFNIKIINDIMLLLFTMGNIYSMVYLVKNKYHHSETYLHNPNKINYDIDNIIKEQPLYTDKNYENYEYYDYAESPDSIDDSSEDDSSEDNTNNNTDDMKKND